MKDIFELIEQTQFSKSDLSDIIGFCRIEGNIAPLCAVAYISSDQKITKEDTLAFARLLGKYPELAIRFLP